MAETNHVFSVSKVLGKTNVEVKDNVLTSLAELEDPKSELSRQWDLEHDQYVLERILQLIEPDFSNTAMQSFRRTSINGEKPVDVAADLNISTAQVYKYRFRIMKRLTQEAKGLVDEGIGSFDLPTDAQIK